MSSNKEELFDQYEKIIGKTKSTTPQLVEGEKKIKKIIKGNINNIKSLLRGQRGVPRDIRRSADNLEGRLKLIEGDFETLKRVKFLQKMKKTDSEIRPALFTIPGMNYCGEKTKIVENLVKGVEPVNRVDAICKQHDIDYNEAQSGDDVRRADNEMLTSLDKLKDEEGFTNINNMKEQAQWTAVNTAISWKIMAEDYLGLPKETFAGIMDSSDKEIEEVTLVFMDKLNNVMGSDSKLVKYLSEVHLATRGPITEKQFIKEVVDEIGFPINKENEKLLSDIYKNKTPIKKSDKKARTEKLKTPTRIPIKDLKNPIRKEVKALKKALLGGKIVSTAELINLMKEYRGNVNDEFDRMGVKLTKNMFINRIKSDFTSKVDKRDKIWEALENILGNDFDKIITPSTEKTKDILEQMKATKDKKEKEELLLKGAKELEDAEEEFDGLVDEYRELIDGDINIDADVLDDGMSDLQEINNFVEDLNKEENKAKFGDVMTELLRVKRLQAYEKLLTRMRKQTQASLDSLLKAKREGENIPDSWLRDVKIQLSDITDRELDMEIELRKHIIDSMPPDEVDSDPLSQVLKSEIILLEDVNVQKPLKLKIMDQIDPKRFLDPIKPVEAEKLLIEKLTIPEQLEVKPFIENIKSIQTPKEPRVTKFQEGINLGKKKMSSNDIDPEMPKLSLADIKILNNLILRSAPISEFTDKLIDGASKDKLQKILAMSRIALTGQVDSEEVLRLLMSRKLDGELKPVNELRQNIKTVKSMLGTFFEKKPEDKPEPEPEPKPEPQPEPKPEPQPEPTTKKGTEEEFRKRKKGTGPFQELTFRRLERLEREVTSKRSILGPERALKFMNLLTKAENELRDTQVTFEPDDKAKIRSILDEVESLMDKIKEGISPEDLVGLEDSIEKGFIELESDFIQEKEEEAKETKEGEEDKPTLKKDPNENIFNETKIEPDIKTGTGAGGTAPPPPTSGSSTGTGNLLPTVPTELQTAQDRVNNTLPRSRLPFFFTLGSDLITQSPAEREVATETFADFSWIKKDGNFENGEDNKIVQMNNANDNLRFDMDNRTGLFAPHMPQPIFKLTPKVPLYDRMRVSLAPQIQHDQVRIPINGRATPGRIVMFSEGLTGLTDIQRRNSIRNRDSFPDVVDGIRV